MKKIFYIFAASLLVACSGSNEGPVIPDAYTEPFTLSVDTDEVEADGVSVVTFSFKDSYGREMLDDRMEEVRQRTMENDNTIASLSSGKRMTAWPYLEFWVFLGTANDGRFIMYYTNDLGETITPIDTAIPDRSYDNAVPVGIWPREDNENTTIIVELTAGDEVEYVGFNHFRGDPFTFTYEDGTPLYQNVGTSYVNLAPLDSVVNWE